MQDERDADLLELFQQQEQKLPDEPFVGNLIKRIENSRSRIVMGQRLVFILGFAGCALLSPYLIKGSILLSSGLNAIFHTGRHLLSTPLGTLSAIFGAMLILFFNRGRLSRFV